jgi:hypothetical protein
MATPLVNKITFFLSFPIQKKWLCILTAHVYMIQYFFSRKSMFYEFWPEVLIRFFKYVNAYTEFLSIILLDQRYKVTWISQYGMLWITCHSHTDTGFIYISILCTCQYIILWLLQTFDTNEKYGTQPPPRGHRLNEALSVRAERVWVPQRSWGLNRR